jgi:hypothetical protein
MLKNLWRHFLKVIKSERGDFGGDDQEEAEQGITQAGEELYKRGKLQLGEEVQYPSSFELGKLAEAIIKSRMGLGEAPAGYLTPTQQYLEGAGDIGANLYNQILTEIKDPYAYYESILQPQLQLAEDYINRGAQRRGLLRSGIPIEQMGRAGVELAIQEANARQQARANALSRAGTLTEYMQGGAGQNLANLANLYGQQQQYGLTAMGRQAGQAQAAAQYQAYPYQYQLGQSGGSYGGLGTALGMLGAAGLSAITKGPGIYGMGLPMSLLLGGVAGGGLGSSFNR